MENCKNCKVVCEHAGTDKKKKCKNFLPIRSCIIKTNSIHSFPSRIVVRSEESGDERVFVPVDGQ